MIIRSLSRLALATAERGLLSDRIVRAGIRRLCRRRLEAERQRVAGRDPVEVILPHLEAEPIAQAVGEANAQHYEVPAPFFQRVLGPRLKYSCGFWDDGARDLEESEVASLEVTCSRAELVDGQDILELGCGWGSLTLWMAERFPSARITAVSNSVGQAAYIRSRLEEMGRDDVQIVTTDMNGFQPAATFDRIVSVEMFEHMRNWSRLLDRVASWLRPDGRFFAHVFCHREIPYLFEDVDEDDWMARNFFTGGLMPSADLMPRVAGSLEHVDTWIWSGTNYEKTANAWLERLDAQHQEVERALAGPGDVPARRAAMRWRLFFMACAELFGMDDGAEWQVAHHAFRRVS